MWLLPAALDMVAFLGDLDGALEGAREGAPSKACKEASTSCEEAIQVARTTLRSQRQRGAL